MYQNHVQGKLSVRGRERPCTDEAKTKRRQSKYSRTDDSVAARNAYSRHDNGIEPDDVCDDVSPEHLTELKKTYYNSKVVVTKEEAEDLERDTREQNESELWMTERRKRLTASRIGSIAKMKRTTKRSSKVQQILYSTFRGNAATRYGIQMEDVARQQYITHQQQQGHSGLKTEKTGLIVSVENPWLAASPDDRVLDPLANPPCGLAEYKNPFSAKDLTLSEACKTVPSFCLEKIEDTYRLKRQHDYYHQVQCQLHCDNKQWCDFVVKTNQDLHVERIHRDQERWDKQLPKLEVFYFNGMLPELACPRYRKGGIREP